MSRQTAAHVIALVVGVSVVAAVVHVHRANLQDPAVEAPSAEEPPADPSWRDVSHASAADPLSDTAPPSPDVADSGPEQPATSAAPVERRDPPRVTMDSLPASDDDWAATGHVDFKAEGSLNRSVPLFDLTDARTRATLVHWANSPEGIRMLRGSTDRRYLARMDILAYLMDHRDEELERAARAFLARSAPDELGQWTLLLSNIGSRWAFDYLLGLTAHPSQEVRSSVWVALKHTITLSGGDADSVREMHVRRVLRQENMTRIQAVAEVDSRIAAVVDAARAAARTESDPAVAKAARDAAAAWEGIQQSGGLGR